MKNPFCNGLLWQGQKLTKFPNAPKATPNACYIITVPGDKSALIIDDNAVN